MADFTIPNESSMEALERGTRKLVASLKSG